MPVNQIRFFRIHVTEEAARAAVMNDYAAFRAAFPDITIIPLYTLPRTPVPTLAASEMAKTIYPERQEYREEVIRERYADEGLVGCMFFIQIETESMIGVGGWLQRLYSAKLIESNPLR